MAGGWQPLPLSCRASPVDNCPRITAALGRASPLGQSSKWKDRVYQPGEVPSFGGKLWKIIVLSNISEAGHGQLMFIIMIISHHYDLYVHNLY